MAVGSWRIGPRDRNGYTAVQLGIGRAKVKNVSKAERGHFAVAKVEPKMKLAEFASRRRAASGRRRDHGGSFRREASSSTITSTGKGFAGAMKRWNLAACGMTTASDLAPVAWFDRRQAGPGQDRSRIRKWPGTSAPRGDDMNLRIVEPISNAVLFSSRARSLELRWLDLACATQ
jgi:large subunit ribosomal protein L3